MVQTKLFSELYFSRDVRFFRVAIIEILKNWFHTMKHIR